MTEETPMRRTVGVTYEPDDRADVADFLADYAHDAVDAGVDATDVMAALRATADEIEQRRVES